MSRLPQLLRTAAESLEGGTDPFRESWLSEHEVTFDECMALSNALATGARLYAWAIENPEEARGAVNGAHMISAYRALNRALTQAVAS